MTNDPINVAIANEYPYQVVLYTQKMNNGAIERTVFFDERVWATGQNPAKQVALLAAAKSDEFPTTLQAVRFAVSDYTVTQGDACARDSS